MMSQTESRTKGKGKKIKIKAFSPDEVNEMIEKARQEEAEKVRAEMTAEEPAYFSDEIDDSERPSIFGSDSMFKSPVNDIDSEDMDDIFTHCDKHYHMKGKLVAYVIKKDGQFVGEQYHPFTWSKIQEKFGGGNFIVMAKDANTKQYIKQQTMLVQEPLNKSDDKEKIVFQQPPAPQQPPIDMKTLLEFVTQAQMLAKSDDKAIAKEEARSTTTIFTALMEANQRSSQQLTDMLFKMQEQTNKTIQAMADNTNKQNAETRNLILELLKNKPKDELTLKDILMLKDSSMKEGFEQMKMIMEIADMKAEEKAEMLASNETESGSIPKLIGSIIPLINATARQVAPPPQQRIPAQRLSQPRRPVQQFQRPPQANPFPTKAPIPQAQNNPVQNRPVQEQSTVSAGIFAPVGVEIEEEIEPVVTQSQSPSELPPVSLDELFAQANDIQQRVATDLIPIIAESMTLTAEQAGQKALPVLNSTSKDLNMPVKALLKEFSFDLIWQTARAFGITNEKHQWFKEFYDFIEKSAESSTNGPS